MKPDVCLKLSPFREEDWFAFAGANRVPRPEQFSQELPCLIGSVTLDAWPELREGDEGALVAVTDGTVIVDALGLSVIGENASMNLHWADEDSSDEEKVRAYLRAQGLTHTLPDASSGAMVPLEWFLTMGFRPNNFGFGFDEMSMEMFSMCGQLLKREPDQLNRMWQEQNAEIQKARKIVACLDAVGECLKHAEMRRTPSAT